MTTLTLQDTKDEAPRSPAMSDNNSIHSSSEHSDTSTLRYEQESFELFRPRVEKLCEMLWPPQPSIRQSLSCSKIATRMHTNRLLRLLVPSPQAPLIERLRGGDYNRIVGISLPSSKTTHNHGRNTILRVPRWGQGQIDRVVATLDYVRQGTSIPVASVIAKDSTRDNPLESPYVLLDRVAGSDLEVLWTTLNHSQRCTVAQEVGRVKRGLLALESPVTGHVAPSSNCIETKNPHVIVPFEVKNADEDLPDELQPQSSHVTRGSRESQTTLDFFKCQIGRWRAVDVARNASMVDRTIGLWDGMLKVVEEMNSLGLFTVERHCLCHVDLYPRNIMVRVQHNGSVQVTGILDWDEAVVAPKFVNCEPPGWLWGFTPYDLWPCEMPGANDTPSTAENQELKRIFEEHAGSEFKTLAYDEHFRMSRALFRIAVFGLTSSENYSAADRIIEDWERLRHTFTEQS